MKPYVAAAAALILTAGLTACASAPATVADKAHTDRIVSVTDNGIRTMPEKLGHEDATFSASPSAVLAALRLAYADIGVEVKYSNAATGEIGNVEFVRRYKMAGQSLTDFVNCGSTVTGPAADTYRVTMLLVSTVKPSGSASGDGTGSTVETRFQSRAIDPAGGTSAGAMECQSLGTLEQKLHDLVRDKLPRAGQ
jgi:hypothetical protein